MAFKIADTKAFIATMTLEEKASLLSGKDFWYTKAIPRLGIESWMMTDGPHGMRKQATSAEKVGLLESVPATCFPTGASLASTWNPELIGEMGRAMGIEARSEGVRVLLGPAVNIKRSPLCGRNFEYLSEDPYLAGEIAKAHIRGIQSVGVGTSIKHFAVNNQEKFRMAVDAIVDERTLREIYLPAFERAIKDAKPWTVMCAYNKVNGTYCSENRKLLTEILRDEWGYEGTLVTDWTACDDRVEGLLAGQDLEMPGNGGINDKEVVKAVRSGRISEADVDRAVSRLLALHERAMAADDLPSVKADHAANHEIARRVAGESAILLKNERQALPLSPSRKIALIGAFAEKPRYQGSGSSHIQPTKLSTLLDALKEQYPDLTYARGYRLETGEVDEALLDEAVRAARAADVAVVCAGLTDIYESEGFDRAHLKLPASHDALIEAVAAARPETVVVLSNGAPVEMPWITKVPAVLEAYLAGQAGGLAIADILTGKTNPSGKLAESFPLRLEDTPCYLNFPGSRERVEYREGVFVGYRHYDSVKEAVLFPFGHGLSYATFEYADLLVSGMPDDGGSVTASVTVKNTGSVAGKETVQFYVSPKSREVPRPEQELKGFAKVSLEPGESTRVSVTLDARAFSWYDADSASWRISPGAYDIRAAASSRDVRQSAEIRSRGTPLPRRAWSRTDTVSDILRYGEFKKLADEVLTFIRGKFAGSAKPGTAEDLMNEAMFLEMPLRALGQFGGPEGDALLARVLATLNA
jgi:beta-glucosidase